VSRYKGAICTGHRGLKQTYTYILTHERRFLTMKVDITGFKKEREGSREKE
jgi:hypothetical protein